MRSFIQKAEFEVGKCFQCPSRSENASKFLKSDTGAPKSTFNQNLSPAKGSHLKFGSKTCKICIERSVIVAFVMKSIKNHP